MSSSGSWEQRLARAGELAKRYPASAEMLGFYARTAGFQRALAASISAGAGKPKQAGRDLTLVPELDLGGFRELLETVAKVGPPGLAQAARALQGQGQEGWGQLLAAYWRKDASLADGEGKYVFFCCSFLQPYAEQARQGWTLPAGAPETTLCPFCGHKPVAGVLREEGVGGKRSLLCSFCLGEWDFRRMVCVSCGQEAPVKLAVYSAEEFPHVRIDACDSCRTYTKTVDLTKDGHAVPLVDEMAAAALDLWAGEHGYRKLQLNLLGM